MHLTKKAGRIFCKVVHSTCKATRLLKISAGQDSKIFVI